MRYGPALFTLLALAWQPAMAEIYKCVAADGRVRYGDRPCAGQATVITPATAPGVDPHLAEHRRRAQKLLRAYDEERAETQRAQAAAEAARQQRLLECRKAREWQTRVSRSARLYRIAEDGNHVALSEAERAGILAKVGADVARWCD